MNTILSFTSAPVVTACKCLRISQKTSRRLKSRPVAPFSNSTMKLKVPASDENSDAYKQFSDMLGNPKHQEPSKSRNRFGNAAHQSDNVEDTGMENREDYEDLAELLGPREGRFRRGHDKTSPGKGAHIGPTATGLDIQKEPLSQEHVDPRVAAEREHANARKRAQAYTEMAELLGPPQGRFQAKAPSVRRHDNRPRQETKTHSIQSDGTHLSRPLDDQSQEEAPPLKKEARTAEEEYALFESLLRNNKGSKKLRKGGRQFATRETVLEGLVTDPWGTDYNLMPKKGVKMEKGAPPTKGQKPFKVPDTIEISEESIDQSYWTLEKLLDDEEADWQEEQKQLRAVDEEKRKAKAARRLLKKPAHPNDPAPSAVAPSETLTEPELVLDPPPRRPRDLSEKATAQDFTRIANIDSTGASSVTLAEPERVLDPPPRRPHDVSEKTLVQDSTRATNIGLAQIPTVPAESKSFLQIPPVRPAVNSDSNPQSTIECLQLRNPKILVAKQILS